MDSCYTCELVARRDAGEAALWDSIHRTPYWDVVHAYDTSLLGWLVLVVRRHIAAIDELTEDEAVELGKLVRWSSIILKELTGCLKTYVVQFAEAPDHPHVHFHVIPRMPDRPDDEISVRIFRHIGVAPADQQSEAAMNEFAGKFRARLLELMRD